MNSRLLCVTAFFLAASCQLVLGASKASARDIISLESDSTTVTLAEGYKVVEVRNAIGLCRNGDFETALPILRKHAKLQDIGATYILARLYTEGLGVEASTETAADLLTVNALGGHTPSMMALAKLVRPSDPEKALILINKASEAGEPSAWTELGNIHESGQLGVQKNLKTALQFFQRAAESGHPVGLYHLARYLDNGIATEADETKATRLYRQAAYGGVVIANVVMAKRYFQGKGIEADQIAAIGWLTRGSQMNSPECMVLLGERYENGDVMKRDLNRAGELFSKAAQLGEPTGYYKLATLYLNGKGTKPDPIRAYVLLSNAQSLPQAKKLFDEVAQKLTAEQLSFANKKIEAAARRAKVLGDFDDSVPELQPPSPRR